MHFRNIVSIQKKPMQLSAEPVVVAAVAAQLDELELQLVE